MAEIEGIYFCPCCNTFRDWQHKKSKLSLLHEVSEKNEP